MSIFYRNLASVWAHFAAGGVSRLLLAVPVESREELDRLHSAIADADFAVCRLTADLSTMQERLRVREPGMLQKQFLARAAELKTVLDGADVEDFCIANDQASVTKVAHELLNRAGWLADQTHS